LGQRDVVGALGQRHPQVQAAAGQRGGSSAGRWRCSAAASASRRARSSRAQPAAVAAPAGRDDDLERGLLQRARDEEVVDDARARAGAPRPRRGAPMPATRSPGAADLVSERT
jgi:hypothetical protein